MALELGVVFVDGFEEAVVPFHKVVVALLKLLESEILEVLVAGGHGIGC